jgi:hypothetical protein
MLRPKTELPYDDIEKIERVVWAEARGEGVEGRDAVRAVILNRLASERFPDTVDEILSASEFEPVRTYGSVSEIPAPEDDLNAQLTEFVDYVQLGEDAVDGRTFFQNTGKTENRGTKFEGPDPIIIGSHTFYRGYAGQEPVYDTNFSHNVEVTYPEYADMGFNKGGLASRPIDPVMEVDGGFLVLTPEKHEDGAPVWKFIPEDVPVSRTSIRPKLRPEMSEEEMRQAFYETKDEMVKQAAIEAGLAEPEEFAKNEYALGGLAVARKGITTKEGYEMADKQFQLDEEEADINNDEELSNYEKARAEAIQKSQVADDPESDEKVGMYHGGMMEPVDPVSGNPIPIGSTAEEVRDDIDINISQGEYVLPADVVKWHGLEKIMMLQEEAKMGLMAMDAMGLIPAVEAEEQEGEVCPKCDGEGCDHCDGTGYHAEEEETPEGNKVEEATVEVSEEEPEVRETEEYAESDYSKKTSMYGMVKKPKFTFIV